MSTTSLVPSVPLNSPQLVGKHDHLNTGQYEGKELICHLRCFTAHSQLRYQSDADLDILRRRLSNAPRPLKKRSSITEPEAPQGPNIQKLLYQRLVMLYDMLKCDKYQT